ncbi:DUF5801 repeats-in-toxin domain-containing protein [Pseudovibrio sp. Ad14]|nr:DUF5801 repeats-in-toxin domain-containing protein [Pseudovibrio sp. Ad14]KZL07779.1 hypothetical protein PsAD14_04169 [Pseudovibrio sp. Ad14]
MSERQASTTITATNTSQAAVPSQVLKIGIATQGQSEVLVRQPGQLVDFSQMLEVPVSLFRYGESLQILFSDGGTLLVEGFFAGDQTDGALILSETQTLTIEEFGALVEILPVDTLQTAAGDGTPIADQLEDPNSSGQDFDDNPDGGPLGPGLNVNDLLRPEDNAGAAAAADDPEQDVDDVPVAGIAEVGALDETDWADAGKGPLSFTGNLNVDFGLDGVSERSLAFQLDAGVPVDRAGTPIRLTADGQPLTYEVQDLIADAANEIGAGSQLLIAKLPNGELVFEVLLNTFPETGEFTFTLHGNLDHLEADVKDILELEFGFQAFDADGDSADSFLIVNVADDLPEIGAPTTGTVDEDGIPDIGNGNDTADGDAPATSHKVTASLDIDWGADDADSDKGGIGDRSVKFDGTPITSQVLTSDGIALVYTVSVDGTEFTATKGVGGDAVFQVTLSDDGSGSYSFELLDNLDHFVAGTEDDIELTFGFVATDSDGDTANSSFTVIVDDDMATITSLELNRFVQVDESAGLDNDDTTDPAVAALFDGVSGKGSDEDMVPQFARDNVVDFAYDDGADGATHKVTLSIDDAASGLQTTAGADILLYLEGDLVVGRVGGETGDAVFAISIDDDGEVSLAQYQSIKQLDTDSHDEFVNLDGKISAVLTVTDGDGDVTSQSVEIGEKIRFGDDGPTITSLELNRFVQVDESAGLDNDDTTDPAVAALFDGVSGKGSDEDMVPQFARDNVVDFAYDDGADGATHKVTLSIDDAASGLQTTAGADILLYLEGDLVVGRVGGETGDAVFAISIDGDGEVSLAQYQSIKQLDTDSHDEFVNLDGKISAVLTVTDGDGDVTSQSIEIGEKIRFGDDGPSVTDQQQDVTVDEDDIDTILSTGTSPDYWGLEADGNWTEFLSGSAIAAGDLQNTVDFGADGDAGAGSFTFVGDAAQQLSDLGLSSDGDAVQFQHAQLSATITLMVGVAGGRPVIGLLLNTETGEFAVLQADQLDHVTGDGENTALQLLNGDELAAIDFGAVIVATDGDGDTVALDGKLDVTVVDDIPAPELWVDDHIRIDETEGDHSDNVPPKWRIRKLFKDVDEKGSDPDLSGPIYARNDVLDFHKNVGADERGSHELVFRIDNADSGLATTEGLAITLHLEDGQIIGRVPDGDAAFAIHLHQNGKVSMVQYMSIEHPDTGSSDEHVSLDGKVSAILTVTDEDGDAVSTEISVGNLLTFDDDGPRVTNQQQDVTVDEDDIDTILSTGTSPDYWGLEADGNWTEFLSGSAIAAGDLQNTVDFGADGDAGAGSFTFVGDAAQQLSDLGLSSDGDAVQFQHAQLSATITLMVGVAGGRPVIGLLLNTETGEFAVLQADQLDHVTGNGENTALQLLNGDELAAIDFGSVIVATDGDGDTVALDGKLDVTVVDDIPAPELWVDDHIRIDETQGPHSDNIPPWIGSDTFKDVTNTGSDFDLNGPIYARNDVLDGSLNVGADEAGSYEVTLEIASDGISSGLFTTEGDEIFLSEENGMIVGRLAGGNGRPEGLAVFAIHVHQNGDVSMVQYMSIKHPDTTSSDEYVSLDGKVTAVLTVTDEDGDVVSTRVQIGEHLTFDDDGPHIHDFAVTGEIVELDETAGQQLDEVVAAPDSDIRALFASLDSQAANDPDMETIYAHNVNLVEANIYIGADGVDAPEVTLEIAAQGTDSGLQTTDGSQINLYTEGDLIVGRAGDANAAVVFAVSIDEYGSLSVVQYASLNHVQSENDHTLDLAGKISAVLTLTDGDGDTDTASVDIGDKIIFHDDEPTATGAGSKITVSEADDFGVATSGTLQFEGGSDGATVTAARIVDDQGYARRIDLEEPKGQRSDFLTVGGEKVILSSTTAPDGVITIEGATETGGATAFTVIVQPDGAYEFTQHLGFDHPDVGEAGSDDRIDLRLRFTVTDGDGDTSTATAVISVEDDEVALTGASQTATADEDDIVNLNSGVQGNAPRDGDLDGSTTGENDNNGPAYLTDNISALVDFGNDGGAFDISTDAVASLTQMALTSGGEPLSYVVIGDKIVGYVETDGNTEYSFQNDRPVFSLDLTSDSGDVVFKLFDQLDHVAGNGENNVQQPLVIDFGSVIDAVDGDGDSVNLAGKFSIKIVDDVPIIDSSSYETNLVVNGSFEEPDIGSSGHKAIDTMSGWMSTNGTKFELHSDSFSPSSDGDQYLELDKDGADSGKVDGIYQNIQTEANTQYELTFDLADRAGNGPTSDVRVLWNGVEVGEYSTNSTDWTTITLNVVGTGQSVGDRLEFIELTALDQNNGLGTYLDDIQLHKVGLVVDEADLASGNAEVSGSLHINWGTDDADSDVASPVHGSDRSVSFINVTDGEQGKTGGNIALESAGAPVLLQAFGAVLIGYTGMAPADANDLSNAVFKVTLSDDGSGTYTFELLGQLDHEGDEGKDLSLSFDFEAKDSDGDSVSGDFTVNILDDVPAGAADNVIGSEDVAFDINVLSNDAVGADKDATVLLENAGVTVKGGSVVVNSDGTVRYSPVADFNGQDSFSYRIEDADGDVSDVITVTVDVTPVNDRPVLTVTNVQSNFAENGVGPVAEFSAFDVDGDALTYSLTGEDAHLFEIRGSEVYFKAAPDFENPLDVDADQDYNFNIVASDGTEDASEDVEVSVTNQAAELNLFFKPGSSDKLKVRDDFEEHNGSYDYGHGHSNGVVTWTGAWIENGNLDGDSDYGDVYVPQQGGAISGHLYFPSWTPNGEGSVSRSVDLTNGENLKLEVSVGNRLEFGDDQFDLLIEWDGGSARIPMFDQSTQSRSEVITIDISNLPGWNPSETTITFEVSGMEGTDDYARVLDVKITGDNVIDPTTEYDIDFTLGGEGVAIADMLGVNDADNDNSNDQLSSAVITLKNYQQGDALSYLPQGAFSGISARAAVVGGNLVLTLSGDASYAAYVAAIKSIEFNTSSDIDTRTIEMVVSNGAEESGVATTTVNVIENADNPNTIVVDYNEPAYSQNKYYENDPDKNSGWHYRLNGTDQNDRIEGQGNWHNDLSGGDGNDLLIGDDWHPSSSRNYSDTFNGGAGYDRMTSGSEDDLDAFIFDVLDGSFDTITDFDGTAQGETDQNVDRLDISDLLNKAFGNDEVDAAEAGQYVKIQENGSGSDVLVDVDGAANGENWSKIAHLDNISNTDTIKVVLDDDGSYSQVDVVA